MTGDELVLGARVDAGPDRFRFRTAAGVHSHDEFRTGDLLALEALWDRDLGRLLCVEAGYGVVGTVVARSADSVTMTESSARAADLCERNARGNGVDARVELVGDVATVGGTFDTAVYVPKPYVPVERGCQRTAEALSALRPGGALYLAAKPRTGLSRYEQCLDRLSRTHSRIGSRDGWTLLRGVRPRGFEPPTYADPVRFTATVDGVAMTLVSAPGLFSAGRVDDGTRLLAETADVRDGDRVLDLCCGYGPLGTYAALTADADVWLTDDDRVATECAERTLDANDADATVRTGDCVAAVRDRSFDHVLCNPPTHAGSGALRDLFAGAADVLARGGRMTFVHHRQLDLSPYLGPFETRERAATGDEHAVRIARQ